MSLNIDTFKGAVSAGGGFAKTNLFVVQLPTNIPGAPVINSNTLNLVCKGAQMPGRQILTSERIIGMKSIKTAYGFLTDDVSLTFHVMNDFKIKEYFEAWQQSVVNTTTQELNYFNEYTRNVEIRQLSKRSSSFQKLASGLVLADAIFELVGSDLLSDNQVAGLLNQTVHGVRLQNAYPTTLNGYELNNELDGMVELNVQLSFKNWRQL